MQNLRLPPGAHEDRFLRPVGHCRLFFSEHALAGAGRVDENFIEPARKACLQPLRMLVQDQRVCDAQPLDVRRENFCALGVDLIADQKPAPAHLSCQLRGFSAGRRAQVQNPLPGLRVQQRRGRHRTCLLQIVKPCLVIGRLSGSCLRVIVKAARLPRHGAQRKAGQIGRRLRFQRIQAQRNRAGTREAVEKGTVLLCQQGFHALCKSLRKHALHLPKKNADTGLLYCMTRKMKRAVLQARAKKRSAPTRNAPHIFRAGKRLRRKTALPPAPRPAAPEASQFRSRQRPQCRLLLRAARSRRRPERARR